MINRAALDLIREFEGFRSGAYKDSSGVWTIGYGTTASAGVGIRPKEGMIISQEEAEKYFLSGVEKFTKVVLSMLTKDATSNQLGAMVSLAYNIGPTAFSKSSVLRRFNAGDIEGAAAAFALWKKAGGVVLPGLVRRRAAEAALFLLKEDNQAPKVALQRLTEVTTAPVKRLATHGWLVTLITTLMTLFGRKPK